MTAQKDAGQMVQREPASSVSSSISNVSGAGERKEETIRLWLEQLQVHLDEGGKIGELSARDLFNEVLRLRSTSLPSVDKVGEEVAKLAQRCDSFMTGTQKLYDQPGPNYGDMWFFELYHHLKECKAAILSSASALESGEGWRDIETAPKDGTLFLAWAPGRDGLDSMQSLCAWHPDAGFCIDELRCATHWQPLPDPPALSTTSGKGE